LTNRGAWAKTAPKPKKTSQKEKADCSKGGADRGPTDRKDRKKGYNGEWTGKKKALTGAERNE